MEGIDCTPAVRTANSQRECSQGIWCNGLERKAGCAADSPQDILHSLARDLQESGWHVDRQRTLRELEVGRTLFNEGGRWVIKHQAGDYKTGRAYGQRPPMIIAPHIYPEVRGPNAGLL